MMSRVKRNMARCIGCHCCVMVCRQHGATGGDIGLKTVETENRAGQIMVRYVHSNARAFDEWARTAEILDYVRYCPTGALSFVP